MKFEFTGTFPERPEMPPRASLGWAYFFGKNPDWACVKTCEDVWIVTDEACNLDDAQIFPDTLAFVNWLDQVAVEHLQDEPEQFLRSFTSTPEFLNQDAIEYITKQLLNQGGETK